jgi:hypothetical protein
MTRDKKELLMIIDEFDRVAAVNNFSRSISFQGFGKN